MRRFMANKTLIPLLVSFMFLVSVPISMAYLDISVLDDDKQAYLGDEVSFDVDVSVSRALGDNVYLEVTGDPQEWVSDVPGFLHVPGMGSASASFSLSPVGETPGTFLYTVSAVSFNKVTRASDSFTLDVKRPLDITDFAASRQGNELYLNVLMDSKDRRDAELSFVILNYRGDFLKRFSMEAVVDGPTLVEGTEQLPEGMLAGDYDVKVSLVGTPVEKEYMFTVLPVHDVVESVKKTSTTFQDDFEVTITNNGNLVEKQYVSYKTVPNNDWITGLVTNPDDCFVSNGEKTCRYVFSDLAPGESATLEYNLNYFPIYAGIALASIALFMIVFFGMRRATAPVIVKRHVRKPGDRHHVVLEVRNPFYHNLSNAIIRDWVTPLANVLHNEISVLKPLVRRSDAGTELIWKLGDIKPRETRIVTYPLKTLVRGSLKMPKAYIRYNKPNGKLKRLFSRGLVIDS